MEPEDGQAGGGLEGGGQVEGGGEEEGADQEEGGGQEEGGDQEEGGGDQEGYQEMVSSILNILIKYHLICLQVREAFKNSSIS